VNLGKVLRYFIGNKQNCGSVPAVSIVVQRGLPVRFICTIDARVECVSGIAWITTEGDIHDAVLGTGQVHIASRGDRLFINGMPECKLVITSGSSLR
jgi:hypothetical protein